MLSGSETVFVGLLTFYLSMGLIHKFRYVIGEKYTRKMIHIMNGIVAASATFVTRPSNYWAVSLTAVFTCSSLVLLRFLSKKKSVYGEAMYTTSKYESYGEVLFPVMFLLLPPVTHLDFKTYCLPVLIITLSDAAAALIGRNVKSLVISDKEEGTKTLAGSGSFFLVTCLILLIGLQWENYVMDICLVGIILLISLSLTVLEATCINGADNLLIPLSVYFYLKHLNDLHYSIELLYLGVFVLLVMWKTPIKKSLLLKMQMLNFWFMFSLCIGWRAGMLVFVPYIVYFLTTRPKKTTVVQTRWLQDCLVIGCFIFSII
ncbi:MAG TPA: hypothetical protein DCW90_25130 [Lachnospiraceae bacterium]|nr:hypothetical protein [uncultured Lachnoclostridium sp.]HAU88637.1 hypothetical protein [Lachnospiraceae bacterium]